MREEREREGEREKEKERGWSHLISQQSPSLSP